MSFRPLRKRAQRAHEIAASRTARDFFEKHGQMVYAVCRLQLRDRLDAEDATQQTFLAAYRSLLRGREPDDPPAWLAAIARNECSRVRKLRSPTIPIDDSEGASADVANVVVQREEIEALATALSELPLSQRNAVVLREFYGLSYAEVSSVLGVSGPAVESLLFKGRRSLQAKLGSLRAAGAIMLPDTVRDALAQALPGFGGASAASAPGIAAVPAITKVAAVAAVVVGGGMTVTDAVHRNPPKPVEIGIEAQKHRRPATAWASRPPVASARVGGAPSARRREAARGIDARTLQNADRGTAEIMDDDGENPVAEQPKEYEAAEREAAEPETVEGDDEQANGVESDEFASTNEVGSTAREQGLDEDEPEEAAENEDDEADDTADSDEDDTLDH